MVLSLLYCFEVLGDNEVVSVIYFVGGYQGQKE